VIEDLEWGSHASSSFNSSRFIKIYEYPKCNSLDCVMCLEKFRNLNNFTQNKSHIIKFALNDAKRSA